MLGISTDRIQLEVLLHPMYNEKIDNLDNQEMLLINLKYQVTTQLMSFIRM